MRFSEKHMETVGLLCPAAFFFENGRTGRQKMNSRNDPKYGIVLDMVNQKNPR